MNAPQAPANLEPLLLESCSPEGVVTLTMNRPAQFNSLSEQMLAALQSTFERLGADAGARVIVIAAAGRAFCAGHDLKQMKANPRQEYYAKLFADCAQLMLTVQR
ncbi:MAG: enoyl-CoA hydratase-related protein, partial [Burkholderiaceae bacterium]|nr:enoyl-CoA hydratase-related protein [Burkholderiaceae bacterium]